MFAAERELLEKHSHRVEEFTRHSDDIRRQGAWGMVKGAFSTPWNPWSAKAISQMVDVFKPEVVHVHNTFPLLSPSIFNSVGARAARVLTLHNYRLVCANGLPMRSGEVCTECIDRRTVLPSVKHGCYRGSRLATVPLAINIALHRYIGTWQSEVDAFVVFTEFQKEKLIAAGLPGRKIYIKPNFYPGSPVVTPWADRDACVVFVGRLSDEKGVRALLNAWQKMGATAPELRLIGDGPLRAELETIASGLPISFLGLLPPEAAQKQIANAKLLVLPSLGIEGFPMVIREAFAFGTPVAVSNVGPLPSIVRGGYNGLVFPTADSQTMADLMRNLWDDSDQLQQMGKAARAEFEQYYTEAANYETLMEIYDAALVGKGHE